jgi:hypothetical protein
MYAVGVVSRTDALLKISTILYASKVRVVRWEDLNEIDCHVFGHAPVGNSYFAHRGAQLGAGIRNLHCTTTMSDDEEQYNVCLSL